MYPQTWHVFDVYAGETYSTGTPAHPALYSMYDWSWRKGNRAILRRLAVPSPFPLLWAYLIPLSLSSTIASLFALAFSTISVETLWRTCLTRSFSLLEPANLFFRRLSWGCLS